METLVQNLTVEGAFQLAGESEEMNELLNQKESLEILQSNLFEKSAWKRTTPVDKEIRQSSSLEELKILYEENFVTAALYFKREDWLSVILSVGDYETLKQIVGMYASELIDLSEEEINKIKENFACYPLDVFKEVFGLIGEDGDAISILQYPNFRPRDKERRLLPFIGRIKNKDLVAKEAFSTAPKVFARLAGNVPHSTFGKVDLNKFQNIERSLFSILSEFEAKEEIKKFAVEVMSDMLKRKVPFQDREQAWQFLSPYLEDGTPREKVLNSLRRLETPDNRLWLRSRLF